MTTLRSAPPGWPGDHPEAEALVREHLPDGAQAGLAPIGEGDFCLAFRQGARVVRVAKHAEAADALRREACVLGGIAARLPLPVPRPAFHEPAPGCAFSIHDEITGEELTRETWEALPSPAREAAASELARFLGALHALPPESAERCGLPVLDGAALAARLLRASRPLHPLLPPEVGRRLDEALARWSEPSKANRSPALLHCDIAPGHVLFDPGSGRLTGVIDFGDLALGDPARDFIYVYEDFGGAMLEAVLRHYPGEPAATLLPRIHRWFLLETVDWLLGLLPDGDPEDVDEGLGIIAHELDALGA